MDPREHEQIRKNSNDNKPFRNRKKKDIAT